MRLIQITDCHLGPHQSETLLGLDTDRSLQDVLQLIQQAEPAFDHLLCTGDVASEGDISCYTRYESIVRRYFAQPLSWLAGNHDDSDLMQATESALGVQGRLVDLGDWLIVLLDSSVPGHVYGQLAASELDFLEHVLASNPTKHVIVSLHHQPVPVGCAWLDQYVVRNAEALFALVDTHANVKLILWGHVHQEFESAHKGIGLLATPSTCVQFKPNCDTFTVDTLMPGYRWLELNEDGTYTSGVSRVTGKHYVIDYKSAGY